MSENRLAAKLTKVDKAAILLLSLGETDAAQVLRHMGPKEVQRVGVAMASMRNVHREQVEQVMGEFVEVVGDQTSLGVGADGYIRKMLTQALGEDKANNLIDRILLGGSTSGLDSLKWMEPRAVADVIRYEHPQIQAIVVAYLDPDQAAEVLSHFDHKVRLDIVLRVSSLNTVQPSALKELNLILEKQFAGNSNATRTTMGGVKRAADIMNYLDSSIEGQLMDSIREVDEDLSGQIEDLMFVFDNLADVDDRGIQALLREVSSDVLVLALKGSDEAIREKVFKNMSKRAAELLRDDLEAKPPATKGYPPSVFAKLPKLVERAGNAEAGGGSITAFYTVLSEGDDQQDPIADAARGVLDGHFVLSRRLAEEGHYPAIDIEASISRVMPQVVEAEHLRDAQRFKQLWSRYQQSRDLISVGAYVAGGDPETDLAIARFPVMRQFLRQGLDESESLAESRARLASLLAGGQA